MNHYVDIKLLPDAEIPAAVLMNAICTKLHKTLCDLHSSYIGISFPKYKITLGNILRIHGSESDLKKHQDNSWLGGMSGYCQVSEVLAVPENTKHRNVSRVQTTMSMSKLRRLQKRGPISEEDVRAYKAKMFTKGLDNPYLELQSGSNGNRHRRYIQFGELRDKPVTGEFDQFGLSKTATVPWF